jgi:hypothetical protein
MRFTPRVGVAHERNLREKFEAGSCDKKRLLDATYRAACTVNALTSAPFLMAAPESTTPAHAFGRSLAVSAAIAPPMECLCIDSVIGVV